MSMFFQGQSVFSMFSVCQLFHLGKVAFTKAKLAALLYAPLQRTSPVCAIPLVYLPLCWEIVTQASEQLFVAKGSSRLTFEAHKKKRRCPCCDLSPQGIGRSRIRRFPSQRMRMSFLAKQWGQSHEPLCKLWNG